VLYNWMLSIHCMQIDGLWDARRVISISNRAHADVLFINIDAPSLRRAC